MPSAGVCLVLVNRPSSLVEQSGPLVSPPSFPVWSLFRPSPSSPVFPGGTSGFCPTNHGSSQPQKASTPPQRAVPAHFFCARHGTLYGNAKSSSNQLPYGCWTGQRIPSASGVRVPMVCTLAIPSHLASLVRADLYLHLL